MLTGMPPVVAAPMAGGPSTPDLVVAVAGAGALGFLAGGGLTAAALDRDLTDVERRTDRPYGVNLFLPSPGPVDPGPVRAYAARLAPVADAAGAVLGEPDWDDEAVDEKLDVLSRHRPAVVSFTFGLPSERRCEAVRRVDALVVATVTTPQEATAAAGLGVDAMVAQGAEAGGHRAAFVDDGVSPGGGPLIDRRTLLAQVREVTGLPVVAAGGVGTGAEVAEAVRLGAAAVAVGTAFLCCPEAGTSRAHRAALLDRRYAETVVTRAFTGRPARGLRNEFADRFDGAAPAAYPEVHRLTRPLRAKAAADGDPTLLHLWAGTGWRSAVAEPAATVVTRLSHAAR